MPRTPRPNAPDDFVRPRLGAGLRAELPRAEPLRAEPLRAGLAFVGRAPEDLGFAGVRDPRAGVFPPPLAVLLFLVADPDMPPR
ncbi:hypothetical protein VSH64_20345 [Amycolatopsis rhabdoformis]|uniref:Uncharacterized protein n=1 Tax=Amycolatopsis rhabdoformis TaxID=1448059 RepID=A0ABZ1IIY6_9PSEU|nr:hypothetical protein [Amycolatopsis rhabdoformis]WSE34409.1 hypothetical protein VSH64_20345 [Amycolatopsis rhabdoformis]